jgi:hypothetical protein
MNEIRLQVRRARRRMVIQQFLSIATWCVFGFLLLAAIGVAIPKIWPIGVKSDIWLWSWVGGSLGLALLVATVWTYLVRRRAQDAAIELDRRFGLRERVASSLSLTEEEVQSEFGKALLQDAERRVARVNIAEKFRIAIAWWNMLPILPTAAIVAVALLIADAAERKKAEAKTASANTLDSKKVIDELTKVKEKILEKRKEETDKGKLEEADKLIKEIQNAIKEMEKKPTVDKKQALVKLSDLSKQLQSQKDRLSAAAETKKQLGNLKDEKGPAEEFTKNLKAGDFEKAAKAMRELQEKVKAGTLSPEEMKQAAKQLEQIKKKMEEMIQERQQNMEELKRQIERKREAGDLQGAAELQKKLDKMESQQKSAEKMQEMADKLEKAAQAMQQGDKQQAQQQMQEMAQQLEQMQQESEEMQTLDGMMMDLAEAKEGMSEEESDNETDEEGKKGGRGRDRRGDRPGDGDGEGTGFGDRPEEETEYGTKKSQVQTKPKQGESIKIGTASGPNSKGISREAAKSIVEAEESTDDDPLTNQTLPRAQRQHAQEYFQKFRKGE